MSNDQTSDTERPYREQVMPKHTWGDGPWQQEPDRLEWYDEATGYPCLLRRNMVASGTWCGYVAVPPGHPAHGKRIDEAPVDDLTVHGGVTHTGLCEGEICHVARPGEPDDVFWIGFDAAHFMDFLPAMVARLNTFEKTPADIVLDKKISDCEDILGFGESYKTVAYMQTECRELAEQLLDLATRYK